MCGISCHLLKQISLITIDLLVSIVYGYNDVKFV